MADMNYDDFDDQPGGRSLAVAMNWAGAILSILLIVGLATWGWQLLVRDVTGVPVVRALEGPMRVAPVEPGGEAAQYQGLAVNRIAEERAGESMADRVVLAPEPTALNEAEDLAMASLAPVREAEPVATPLDTAPAPAEAVVVEEPSATDMAVAEALAGIVGLSVEEVSFTPGAGGVPASTPRPLGRPDDGRLASLRPVLNDATGEIDAATVPAGTRLVQLGAFKDGDLARQQWAAVSARFGDFMAGKERVVQEAQTGGKTFYRLRAHGFDDLSDARRFCAVLVAEGANCIPVVQE